MTTTGRPRPTQAQFSSLLQLTFKLEEKGRFPTEFEDISLFFRAIAYQQFLYQRRASILVVGRQMLYFSDLPDDHYIAQTFESLTGMKLQRFLTLSQVLLLAFADAPTRRCIDASFFSTLGSGFSQQEVELFLSLFATSRTEMRKFLLDLDASIIKSGAQPRNASEIYEQTPFVERPLIRQHKSYQCIDVHLLDACVGRFIYSKLRAQGNAEKKLFMSHFGPIFEAYVRKAIAHMNLPFQEEAAMAELVAAKNKPSLVDFVVTDNGSRIFIDAKAVEMHYRGKVTHLTSELARNLETSLLKAMKQAHSTMQVLAGLGMGPSPNTDGSDFLVVVTESELYVSNGVILASAVGQETVDKLIRKDNQLAAIPLDRMYFLTIQEFERLAEAVHNGHCGFASALSKAREAESRPETQRMVFGQHLDDMGIRTAAPDYLIEETTNALHSLTEMIRRETT